MTDDPDAYGKILGRNFSGARGRLQLSQAAVSRRMKKLGFEWHQQTVAAIEKGSRRVTAEEVLALSAVLRTSITALLSPGDEELVVTFPAGQPVSSELVRRSARGDRAGMPRWEVRWDDDEPRFPPPDLGWFRRVADDDPGPDAAMQTGVRGDG